MLGPYCRSKYLAEQEVSNAATRGLPVIIVNPTMPIGPGDYRLTPPTGMVLDFLNGKNPAYMDCEMNLVDVRDVALGHILAADRGRIGERYILGGETVPTSRLLEILTDFTGLAMPRTRVPYLLALGIAGASGICNISKAGWLWIEADMETSSVWVAIYDCVVSAPPAIRLADTAIHDADH